MKKRSKKYKCKIVKKSNIKIGTKYSYQLKNPAKSPEYLAKLDNEEVILNIMYDVDSDGWPVYRKYYGILEKYYLHNIYNFKFNPLNQWKYKEKEKQEKVQPIKRANKDPEFIDHGNEFDHEIILNEEFENDEPTFEYTFRYHDIANVDKNEIILFSGTVFDPTPIHL